MKIIVVIAFTLLTESCGLIEIPANTPVVLTLNSSIEETLSLSNISSHVTYVTCQVHSQIHNVTLSMTPKPHVEKSVTGNDIGIVSVLETSQVQVTWYLVNNHTETVQVVIATYTYGESAPLPGGCNQEFNLEFDANFLLHYTDTMTKLEYQWANYMNESRTKYQADCEDQNLQNTLEYHLYVYYLPENDISQESYTDAVKKMMTVSDILNHGVKLKTSSNRASYDKPEFTLASYMGVGVVYNIIVTEKSLQGGTTMSAYVPVVSYACDLQNSNSCHLYGIFWKIVSVFACLVGIFLNFFGHRYFKTGNFTCAFLGFCVVFYSIFGLVSHTTETVHLVLMCILSIVCASLWLGLWALAKAPVVNVLLTGLVAGYLLSSIVFYTPFGNLSYWDKQFNYGMSFTCGVLAIPVFLLAFTKLLNITACAFIGSYLIVLLPDFFLNTGIKMILLNSLQHSTDKDYISVINTGPFRTTEIILTVIWGMLLVIGISVQFYRERGRPDFPKSFRTQPQTEDGRVPARYTIQRRDESDENVGERSPLIREPVSRYTENQPIVKTQREVVYPT